MRVLIFGGRDFVGGKHHFYWLDSGIDVAIQFPGGTGTADMRRRLDKAGVKVYAYED